ncbi:hypothetical protein CPB84DRAFT_1796607 [Gymnopilus junonius]|uniref:Transmembrane protein n=1 Tax=Gymnopilus junonius TaxID=109634 RepID=A0A9P5NBR5_GYMJU|nr:hypothetical protein CPB84DRAFT_1796607 [Gymnopilus junonius]
MKPPIYERSSSTTGNHINLASWRDIPHHFKFSIYWIGLITTSLLIFLVPASRLVSTPLHFQAPIIGSYGYFNPEVTLIAEAIAVDPVARTVVMNWYPAYPQISCNQSIPPVVIDIYVSFLLLDTSSPSWSSNLQDQPVHRINTTETCFGLISPLSSFRTVTKLVASKEYAVFPSLSQQSTFQSYPFDVYLAPFLFYTRNLQTNVVLAPSVTNAFGVAVNFEISLDGNAILDQNEIANNLQFYLRIERSKGTKAFVVLVAIINWLTATAFLTICAATIVYRPPRIYGEMFVVPVGALFAFSSIRSNLPGAPTGFGATIDTFTILPVLVIMGLCSFTLLVVILYRRIDQEFGSNTKEKDSNREEDQTIQRMSIPTPKLPTLRLLNIPHVHSGRSSSESTRAEEPNQVRTPELPTTNLRPGSIARTKLEFL